MSYFSTHPMSIEVLLNVTYSALGHPLGCTGARQVVTALSELRRQNKRIAVTSMCVGTVSLSILEVKWIVDQMVN